MNIDMVQIVDVTPEKCSDYHRDCQKRVQLLNYSGR
jgi:hypothetical protein